MEQTINPRDAADSMLKIYQEFSFEQFGQTSLTHYGDERLQTYFALLHPDVREETFFLFLDKLEDEGIKYDTEQFKRTIH